MRRPLHTLKIWGAGVNSPRRYGAEFVFFVRFFVCPSRYDARHKKPRRCVYSLNLGGMGISSPDNFSYRSNFRFSCRSRSTTSGDIFYCSGSRQLNHSSCTFSCFTDEQQQKIPCWSNNYKCHLTFSFSVPSRFRSSRLFNLPGASSEGNEE